MSRRRLSTVEPGRLFDVPLSVVAALLLLDGMDFLTPRSLAWFCAESPIASVVRLRELGSLGWAAEAGTRAAPALWRLSARGRLVLESRLVGTAEEASTRVDTPVFKAGRRWG